MLALAGTQLAGEELADVFSADLARFEQQATAPVLERRLAAARALASLGHRLAEPALLRLLEDDSVDVRREAAFGLGRLGGRRAVEALIAHLDDEDPWVRSHSQRSLERLTGWPGPPDPDRRWWQKRWRERATAAREKELIERLAATGTRVAALRELALVGGTATEDALLDLHRRGAVGEAEWELFFRTLGRVAGPRSIGVLGSGLPRYPAAAWALGDVGGEAAERVLLDRQRRAGRPDLSILLNLDRLHSKALFPLAPKLLFSFGLVSYRSHPDDLHLDPTPLQRVAATLLIRSGRAHEIVELLLAKLEGKKLPRGEEVPAEVRALVELLERMDEELKPGFHRADGYAQAQPLAALPHLVVDPALAPRLVALLGHPALVVRVYAGTALAKLQVPAAARTIVPLLHSGYPFPESATQASGKHGPRVSGSVRWKGYLAMALGWDRSDTARQALEALLVDAAVPRDIRFGAAVGLGRSADRRSKPALVRARQADVVWWIRAETGRALRTIAIEETMQAAARSGEPAQGASL